jgi:hypothetical protein
MRLNNTRNNRLTSPSEEEDDYDASDRVASPPAGSQLRFQSDQDVTVSQHQPSHLRFRSQSRQSALYPYEYGYNADSRERKIFVAREGQNIFNLGAKLQNSANRKPAPIGPQVDSSADLQPFE